MKTVLENKKAILTIIVGVLAGIVLLAAGAVFGVRGVEKMRHQAYENKRDKQRAEASQTKMRPYMATPLQKQLIEQHIKPRLEEVKAFVECRKCIRDDGTTNRPKDRTAVFDSMIRQQEGEYVFAAGNEIRALPNNEQTDDVRRSIAQKYIKRFDAWFEPKWKLVQEAGPGEKNWHLRFELDRN